MGFFFNIRDKFRFRLAKRKSVPASNLLSEQILINEEPEIYPGMETNYPYAIKTRRKARNAPPSPPPLPTCRVQGDDCLESGWLQKGQLETVGPPPSSFRTSQHGQNTNPVWISSLQQTDEDSLLVIMMILPIRWQQSSISCWRCSS